MRVWPIPADPDVPVAAVALERERRGARFSLHDELDAALTGHEIALTHDAAHVVTWSPSHFHSLMEARVRIWSRDGELLWTGPNVSDVAVHPTRNELAIADLERPLVGWPLDEEPMRSVEPGFLVETVDFSPDGQRLALGGQRTLEGRASTPDPWIRVIDAASWDTIHERSLRQLDVMELKNWTHRVRFSPSGRFIGVSLGKGFLPGAIDALTGKSVWSGGFRGGRMWAIFDVDWAAPGVISHSYREREFVDVSRPDAALDLPPGALGIVNSAGIDDLIVVFDPPGPVESSIQRRNPRTGAVRWTAR